MPAQPRNNTISVALLACRPITGSMEIIDSIESFIEYFMFDGSIDDIAIMIANWRHYLYYEAIITIIPLLCSHKIALRPVLLYILIYYSIVNFCHSRICEH